VKIRRLLLWTHLVVGLVAAIVLVLLGVTGAMMVFETEIDHALNSKLYYVTPEGARLELDDLVGKVEKAKGAKVGSVMLPSEDDIAITLGLRTPDGKSSSVTANPYSGEVIGALSTANTFTQKLHQFHKNLLLGEKGKWITGWGAGLLVVLAITGLILWWPLKLWKFSRGALKSGRRTNYDLHNVLGFYSSIFMLIFGVTGLVIHWDDEAITLVAKITHGPGRLPVPTPKPSAAGVAPIGFGALADAATKAVPGAKIVWIQKGADVRVAVRVAMRFPEDRTPVGRTTVYMHPITGEVLQSQTSRTAPLAYRMIGYWNRQLHTGDTLGWFSRILACLMSLALPLLAITGPLIWWGKMKRKKMGTQGAEA
jgi:uncharacterized iron-regulated membrane protein